MTSSQSDSSMLKHILSRRMPALLTRMSSWPKVSTAWSTRAFAPSHELTSDGVDGGVAAAGPDELHDLLGGVLVAALALEGGADVVDDDLGALGGQQEGLLTSDPPACAGDDGDLAVEHSHGVLLSGSGSCRLICDVDHRAADVDDVAEPGKHGRNPPPPQEQDRP